MIPVIEQTPSSTVNNFLVTELIVLFHFKKFSRFYCGLFKNYNFLNLFKVQDIEKQAFDVYQF